MSKEHANTIREYARKLLALADSLDGTGPGRTTSPSTPDVRPVVADIDGQYGNPVVKRDPKRWDGESCAGRQYSDCPPEYLECLAGFLEWCADRDAEKGPEKEKFVRYQRLDAARARAWAERIRTGGAAQASPEDEARAGDDDGFGDAAPSGGGGIADDDIPFARFE